MFVYTDAKVSENAKTFGMLLFLLCKEVVLMNDLRIFLFIGLGVAGVVIMIFFHTQTARVIPLRHRQ